ncbi:MAG: ankyrin repeat domain-containing protein, partial [Phycisphaerae bacterium]|nr:ankyrin repeat domain-containing protein [Phycisphaerae bacterium]NIP55777.1 ankyrin repeat domain-containing protein [Phycisphaerae bacterium]NIS53109.1 ankyrin repeat domain-containing protein [Phycisphaerae bacterium]NIU59908.1 ankyrin repeat domain-containing protein [Phycisphaerae bacterium]NIX30238.1 ankyrin repeat domain-containing protein [Phycisphaerae bacterium]
MWKLERAAVRATMQPLRMVFVLLIVLLIPLVGAAQDVNKDFLDAAFRGRTSIVKDLLAQGADINAKDAIGATALLGAARNGHPETVELLLAKGAVVDVQLAGSGATPLMYASLNGHNDIVVALLDKGAEVNRKSKRGRPALMYAIMGDRSEVVQTLLARGAE